MEPNPPTEQLQSQPQYQHTNKWKPIAIIFVVISVLFVGLSAFLLIQSFNDKIEDDQTVIDGDEKEVDKEEKDEVATNTFTITEWNIEFTIPDTLTDVRYIIDNSQDPFSGIGGGGAGASTAYIIARPSDGSAQYPSDINSRIKEFSQTILIRLPSSPIDSGSQGIVEGKKVGDYYFYTSGGSFSNIGGGFLVPTIFGESEAQRNIGMTVGNQLRNVMLPTIRSAN